MRSVRTITRLWLMRVSILSMICRRYIIRYQRKPLKPHYLLDRNIAILKLFPGISPQVVESILNIPGLKGVVMETFGSGNAPARNGS